MCACGVFCAQFMCACGLVQENIVCMWRFLCACMHTVFVCMWFSLGNYCVHVAVFCVHACQMVLGMELRGRPGSIRSLLTL